MKNQLAIAKRLITKPYSYLIAFPEPIIQYLEKNLHPYRILPEREKRKVHRLILHFLSCKKCVGANGFELEIQHRYVVAFLAVRMIRHLGLKQYDSIHTIVIFPASFRTEGIPYKMDGITGENGILGLSWRAIESGFRIPDDGSCPVTHEFSHAMDLSFEAFDGIPSLKSPLFREEWRKNLHSKFSEIKQEIFDSAAFVNDESELFAYLSELYFENPDFLRNEKPNVYLVMNRFFKNYSD